MVKVEVLPVPPEMVPLVWKSVCRVALSKIPGYDIERTHTRLLVGLDRLWVAYRIYNDLVGVIITSLSDRPPSKHKWFQRDDPALMRSLTIHLAGQRELRTWIDSAVERLARYARQHGCRQLFILTKKTWHQHAKRFYYSGKWEGVAVGRDRATKSTCRVFRFRNTPGYFRRMVPVPAEKWTRHMYGFISTFYFKEAA